MALGAERSGVTALVMRGAVLQTVLGLALGIPVAFLTVRFVEAELYEVSGIGTPVLALAVVVLLIAASIAALIPARR